MFSKNDSWGKKNKIISAVIIGIICALTLLHAILTINSQTTLFFNKKEKIALASSHAVYEYVKKPTSFKVNSIQIKDNDDDTYELIVGIAKQGSSKYYKVIATKSDEGYDTKISYLEKAQNIKDASEVNAEKIQRRFTQEKYDSRNR